VLEALAVDFASVTALKKLILENAVVTRRIILQHKEDFLLSLIEILTAENQYDLLKAISELQEVFSFTVPVIHPEKKAKENRIEIWEQLLWLSAAGNNLSTVKLVEKVLVINLSNASMIKPVITAISSRLNIILPVLKILEEKPGIFPEKLPLAINETRKIPDSKKTEPIESIDEEGVFVQYAGVVLVHPFLPSLFKRLQLVKEGKFETVDAQQKALYLLYYLATGNTAAEEFELAVPKVLCNWPLEMPVKKFIELGKDELSEADNMLEAVIEQWTVLKNTSIAGLREGFLLRNGKLFRKKDNLYLQAENKSIDVLLDQLPWNLSMIKLPWMKELLRVEWR
jgi:hypothetical protein